jgi:hypothetical protein
MENAMNQLFRSTLFLVVGAFSFNANATLMPVSGDQTRYDTDLSITWQSNGNALDGSGLDDWAAGAGSWDNANDWAASLNVEGMSTFSHGLFSNLTDTADWSSTDYAPDDTRAWSFKFVNGLQGISPKDRNLLAIAVDDGAFGTALVTATVPVPAAVWLFGSALGLLAWLRRRRVN